MQRARQGEVAAALATLALAIAILATALAAARSAADKAEDTAEPAVVEPLVVEPAAEPAVVEPVVVKPAAEPIGESVAVKPASAVSPMAGAVEPRATHRGLARVFVCTGVDCYGLGGGATLIEIEELCAEATARLSDGGRSDGRGGLVVQCVAGTCTLQCANAPNVNVQQVRVLDSHAHDVHGGGTTTTYAATSNHMGVD